MQIIVDLFAKKSRLTVRLFYSLSFHFEKKPTQHYTLKTRWRRPVELKMFSDYNYLLDISFIDRALRVQRIHGNDNV